MNPAHAVKQLRKDVWISALAIVSVAIGLHDIARPRTDSHLTTMDILDLLIVAIFIVEFIYSARRSGNWKKYTKEHWYELPSLLPLTANMTQGAEAVPILRGLRLVRLIRVARLLRVVGAAARLQTFWRNALRIARRAHIGSLAIFAALLILVGAGLAWLFEAPTNESFRGGHSIWWALNMISNVAYVDFQPRTLGGRIVAGLLEVCGIAFIGLFTASLANALLSDKPDTPEDHSKAPLD